MTVRRNLPWLSVREQQLELGRVGDGGKALLGAVLAVDFEDRVAEMLGDERWRQRETEAWRLADALLSGASDELVAVLEDAGVVTLAYVALDALVSAQALLVCCGKADLAPFGMVHHAVLSKAAGPLAPWRFSASWARSAQLVFDAIADPGIVHLVLLRTAVEDLDVLCAVAVCALAGAAETIFAEAARTELALRFAPTSEIPSDVVARLGEGV